ncbi:MAG: sigma-54 dependent transcriptional regulator, partial [Planctomycetia bacterium]|nr:sigma-54 dependent transcriptional regulator [Planctomycetia bacterium]
MNSSISILFVDDDPQVLRSSAEWLGSYGHSVRQAHSMETAVDTLTEFPIDLAFVDLRLGHESGMDVLLFIKETSPETPVVLLSGLATIEDAVTALRLGALDFLTKPLLDNKILEIIESVQKAKTEKKTENKSENKPENKPENKLEKQTVKKTEKVTVSEILETPKNSPIQTLSAWEPVRNGIIGKSSAMSAIYEIVERIADTRATVLITGESGTGKSLLARAIHRASRRQNAPFVEVACGALPDTLLESELFGHEAGAFTGAVSKKIGRFLQADGGTIFLDEIGTASQALQIKLLRVLQEFEFEPVGGTKTHHIDTRVILATNENLAQAVADGTFRQDLFYRINVINLELPPLRKRTDDLLPLAEFFLKKACHESHRTVHGFLPETVEIMMRYSWPGNVRELQNVVERSVFLGRSEWVTPEDLPASVLDFQHENSRRNGLQGNDSQR